MIKTSETREESSYYSIAQWEIPTLALNPNFGIEHIIIVIPCQSRDFSLSYAVIATIVLLLFHYFLSLGSLFHFFNL